MTDRSKHCSDETRRDSLQNVSPPDVTCHHGSVHLCAQRECRHVCAPRLALINGDDRANPAIYIQLVRHDLMWACLPPW